MDAAIPAERNVTQKKAEKESKIQEFMYRDTMNVEHEMHGDTSNKWGQVTKGLVKRKTGGNSRKIFNRLTTENMYWNCAHNAESTPV
jgi:hypothetical protein